MFYGGLVTYGLVVTSVTASVDRVAVTEGDDGYEFASLLKSSEILSPTLQTHTTMFLTTRRLNQQACSCIFLFGVSG